MDSQLEETPLTKSEGFLTLFSGGGGADEREKSEGMSLAFFRRAMTRGRMPSRIKHSSSLTSRGGGEPETQNPDFFSPIHSGEPKEEEEEEEEERGGFIGLALG